MRHLLIPLVFLGGCSDPLAPVEEGAFWLLDATDDVLWHGYENSKLSELVPQALRDGTGFHVGEPAWSAVMRKLKEGKEGPLRDYERFAVPDGKEVHLQVPGVFNLRFTATAVSVEQTSVQYRFRWEGRPPMEGRLDLSSRAIFGFVAPKGKDRYVLLVVGLMELDPPVIRDGEDFG